MTRSDELFHGLTSAKDHIRLLASDSGQGQALNLDENQFKNQGDGILDRIYAALSGFVRKRQNVVSDGSELQFPVVRGSLPEDVNVEVFGVQLSAQDCAHVLGLWGEDEGYSMSEYVSPFGESLIVVKRRGGDDLV